MSDLDFIAKVKWFKGAAKVKWCMVGVAKIKRSRMSPRSKTANSAASNNCCQAVAGESDFIAFISWPSALTRKGGDLRNVPRREMLQNTTGECCSSSNISKIQTVDADNIKAHPCSSRHRLLLYVCVLFDGLDQNAGHVHVSALSFDSENAADPQMAVQQNSFPSEKNIGRGYNSLCQLDRREMCSDDGPCTNGGWTFSLFLLAMGSNLRMTKWAGG